jgi:hypothetical protein
LLTIARKSALACNEKCLSSHGTCIAIERTTLEREVVPMHKMLRRLTSVVLVGAAVSSSACGAADMNGEAETDESVLHEPFLQASCGSMICNSANSCATLDVPSSCLHQPSTLTALPPYGSGACPSQYVLADKTPPTNGGSVTPYFSWVGTPLTQANCSSAQVDIALYAKTGAAAAPVLVGGRRYKGIWWDGTHCRLTTYDPDPSVPANANLKEVRVAGSAKLGASQQRLRFGFRRLCQ